MSRTRLAIVVFLAVAVAACSSAGAPTTAPTDPPPTAPPPGDPGGGGGEPGAPGGDGIELVEPQPGQQNVHPVPLERLEATAEGRIVTVDAYWTSGVAPCYVLDQVVVRINDDQTVGVTVSEGTSDPDAICVMMAQPKHTIFSVEVPGPGTWTVRDTEGGAAPVEVTVG